MWTGAAAVMVGLYLIGYNTHQTSCSPYLGCIPTSAVTHPWLAVKFFVSLIGNVIPYQFTTSQPGSYFGVRPSSAVRFEVVGAIVLVFAIYVIVQSVRERRTREQLPVPFLLVLFALLFDASVTWGRLGEGLNSPLMGNRYVLANLVLLSGITMYAWVHLPIWFRSEGLQRVIAWGAAGILTALVSLQVIVATTVGLTAGANIHNFNHQSARMAVNVDRTPEADRFCELTHYLIPMEDVAAARNAQISEFAPSTRQKLAQEAAPVLISCLRR